MPAEVVTVELPTPFFQQLKRRAEAEHRSVEQQLLSVVATAAPTLNDLSQGIEEMLMQLSLLDDESLWQAAHARVSPDESERTEELHTKRRRQGLTELENGELERLMAHYERMMLLRAQAAATLKQRGHEVTIVLTRKP